MRHRLLLAVFFLASITASPVVAGDLAVTNGRVASGAQSISVPATIEWRNAWRNERNHDAVWLFAKVRDGGGGWDHARLLSVEVVRATTPLACVVTADHIGAWCAVSAAYRGDVSAELRLRLDPASVEGTAEDDRTPPALEARVFGLEMVYVPDGAFSVGDRDAASVERAAFYRSNASGGHDGPFRVTSEAAIEVAPREGALYYQTPQAQYQGDRQGPIPAAFPKGTRAFYAMKYELTQGQYADFLNHISPEGAAFRAIHGGPAYYDHRGTIRLEGGAYVADRPHRPANWVSWDDGIAFADWAGLRPMTEFEFTKAARGSVDPVARDYPWGTASLASLARRVGDDLDLAGTGTADEATLSDETRASLGASYYWVMDLAGSVWERVVSAGHPAGRAFRGTHGDGELRSYGRATNEDWPSGDHYGGGYGYRGGGFYELDRERADGDREYNPYSPVAWRPYGAWGGAPRSVAYGFRAVRSADPAPATRSTASTGR